MKQIQAMTKQLPLKAGYSVGDPDIYLGAKLKKI
jgi:hypothetical protein